MKNGTMLQWLALLMLQGAALPLAEAQAWQSRWQEPAAPIAVHEDFNARLHSAADGSIVAFPMRVLNPTDIEVLAQSLLARFGTAGSEAIGSGSASRSGASPGDRVLMLGDGSQVTLSDLVTRFDAAGNTLWVIGNPSRAGSYSALADLGGDQLLWVGVVSGRLLAMRLTASSGRIVESVDLATTVSSSCYGFTLAGSGAGSFFVVASCLPGRAIKITASPLARDVAWQLPNGFFAATNDTNVVADASGVTVVDWTSSPYRVGKFALADATPLWSHVAADNRSANAVWRGPGGELLLQLSADDGSQAISRIDATNGNALWTTPLIGVVIDMAWTAGAVLVGGADSNTSNEARGLIARLDLSNGAIQWQRSLDTPQDVPSRVTGVAIQGSQVVAIGARCSDSDFRVCEAALWRSASASGAELSSDRVAMRTGNALKGPVRFGIDESWAATREAGPAGPRLRLRRLRHSDGALLLETFLPVPPSLPPYTDQFQRVIETRDGNIAVLLWDGKSPGAVGYPPTASITKLNGQTGMVLWSHSLVDTAGHQLDLENPSIAVDTAGGVLVSTAGRISDAGSKILVASVTKLASQTGAVQWSFASPVNYLALLNTARVDSVGDDFLAYGYANGSGPIGWKRVRSADGATMWFNASLPGVPFPMASGRLFSTTTSGSTLSLHRIDAATGAVAWTGNYSNPADALYNSTQFMEAPDQSIYLGARRRVTTGFQPLVVRFEPGDGGLSWANRFESISAPPSFNAFPRFVDGSVVYLGVRDIRVGATLLMGLSTVDGSPLGAQLQYDAPWETPQLAHDSGGQYGLAGDGGLLLGASSRLPGQPARALIEKRAAPSAAVLGSVRVTLAVMPSSSAGLPARSYVLEAINDGAVSAPGLTARLAVPEQLVIEGASCMLEGSPCSAAQDRAAGVAMVDLPAGATLRLSGRVVDLPGSSANATLTASAFAAYGFAEINVADNVASMTLYDTIFRNGVD